MTNTELENIIASIRHWHVKMTVRCITAEKVGDFLTRKMKEKLMQLEMIGNALDNYDVDAGLFTESEMLQLIRDANDITLQYANNSIYA
jgi:hypothetical protein